MFPTQIQTDRLRLEQFCRENVDVDELYARFGVEAPHVEGIFSQIPDDPFVTEKYVEAANGEFTGITPNNEWCGDDLRDARRYAVRAADFAKRESNSNGS